MSQQEFAPQSQSQQSQELRTEGQHLLSDNEIYYPQHPYYWSKGEDKAGLPRDEPPSSYDEPAMQRGYQAQDYAGGTQHTAGTSGSRPEWRQQFSHDGDAYEQGYRYNAWRTVPPWARPQPQQKNAVRLALLIVLGLLLIKPILILMGLLIAVIGLTLLAVVLPIVIAVGVVSIVLIALRVAFWQRRIHYRQHYSRVWRGPWGW